MTYVNLASLNKQHRAGQIITDIGNGGLMNIYTGAYPASPDLAPSGYLLAALPLSSPAGIASLAVQSGLVTTPGTGGTDGVYTLTITGGGGTGAAGTYTVTGGVLSSIVMSNNGYGYTSVPTFSGFGTAGLSGAVATAIMTGIMVFSTISTVTAVATGIAGFVRVATSAGVGIVDMDIGTTNAYSVVINNTYINSGGSITVSADLLIEA